MASSAQEFHADLERGFMPFLSSTISKADGPNIPTTSGDTVSIAQGLRNEAYGYNDLRLLQTSC